MERRLVADMHPRELDGFIAAVLLPDTKFRTQIRQAVRDICEFLKQRGFRDARPPVRVLKVVKGGSSGKGTSLKGGSDADLVVFVSSLQSYQQQLRDRREILQEIMKQLQIWEKEQRLRVKFQISRHDNPRVLSFQLMSGDGREWVDFDVLPAYDALGQITANFVKPKPEIYIELIKACNIGGEFSTCFTELQKKFLTERCTKLKSLIRLVKYWYIQCKEKLQNSRSLPPKYALELLTVYAWEKGSQSTAFETAEGFRTVLELVKRYKELLIYWTVYYDFANAIIGDFLRKQLRKTRPVILDPADPTGDVGGGLNWNWQLLAKEAEIWCTRWDVKPWNVPVITHSEESSCWLL
ncbi:2'-5'-oligoadenylate synthase 1 [Tachyglossus aculeatus]|uniref:2'-5'-oligoadenylate synthase 1 n=1 Tax=Tachyglossus aculeatus TaxID=9261 RepID=UPI0018F2DFED|nr:2'-5'-oligoadenylate synthase 1 [Tachyglossus aculeatus]